MRLYRLALLSVLLLCPPPVGAVTFTVTATTDGVDATPGDGACDIGGGACTLRGAVQEANALAGPDDIAVPAGTFTLTRNGAEGLDAAAEGDLDVEETLTVTGAGPGQTIIDGNGITRVFDVAADAIITNLTVRGGQGGNDGGGLLVSGSVALTLRDARLEGNQAVHGGAMSVFDGGTTATIERVSISTNTGTTSGAAIEIDGGDVSMRNVTVSGNVSSQPELVNGGTLALEHVTIKGDVIGGSTLVTAGTTTADRCVLDAGAAGDVCSAGTFTSLGGNVEHGTGCGFVMAGDVSGQDPELGPLADNGSGTLTHALAPTSPAIDVAAGCPPPAEDQRGVARPIDGNGDTTAACDAGAFELDPNAPPTTSTSTTTTTQPGGCAATTGYTNALCEIDGLTATLTAGVPAGTFRVKLLAAVTIARERVTTAETATRTRLRKRNLARAIRSLKQVRVRLGKKPGRTAVPDAATRAALQTQADRVRAIVVVLRGLA